MIEKLPQAYQLTKARQNILFDGDRKAPLRREVTIFQAEQMHKFIEEIEKEKK